jgi:hypothetical protein
VLPTNLNIYAFGFMYITGTRKKESYPYLNYEENGGDVLELDLCAIQNKV